MQKFYSVVLLSVAFLLSNCYAQEHYFEPGPAAYPNCSQSGCVEFQAGTNTDYAQPLVEALVAPEAPFQIAPAPAQVIAQPQLVVAKPVLQQDVDTPAVKPIEESKVKYNIETAKVLELKNKSSLSPLKNGLEAV